MKTVFITGAAGFIGGYIAEEFSARGWHVIALVHKTVSADLERMAGADLATLVRGDTADPASMETILQDSPDVLVHCAGRASDVGWRREFRRANFESVQHLVELTKRLAVGRFVFVSTTDVYGLRDFNGEGEDELSLEGHPRNPYPEFKILAEQWIRKELPPQRFAIVRPGAVWGVGDPTLTPRIVDFLRHSPCIVHFGAWRGENRWPLAHVRNVAMLTFLASSLDEAAGRAINVLDSERTSLDAFYRLVACIYLPRKKLRTVVLPLWLGRAFGGVVSAISNLLNLDQPFTDPSLYALHSVTSDLDLSNRRMLELFEKAARKAFTKEEGLQELRASTGPSS